MEFKFLDSRVTLDWVLQPESLIKKKSSTLLCHSREHSPKLAYQQTASVFTSLTSATVASERREKVMRVLLNGIHRHCSQTERSPSILQLQFPNNPLTPSQRNFNRSICITETCQQTRMWSKSHLISMSQLMPQPQASFQCPTLPITLVSLQPLFNRENQTSQLYFGSKAHLCRQWHP